MSTTATPPPKKVNHIGLEVLNYKGGKTTLCAGCGHNSISERIVECFYEMGIEPYNVAKFSGIGCSSKSPAYFLGLSHDGSVLRIRKLQRDYDPTNRVAAATVLQEADAKGEVLTGVLYVDTGKPTFIDLLNLAEEPLATLPEARVRPTRAVLDQVMDELR